MAVVTEADALIAARDLSVEFAGRRVLDAVTLAVAPGEIVTVVGPNGSGKTTLARALLGLVQPSAGRVERRPGLTVGYVPQRLHVEPTLPLTVQRLLTLTTRRPRAELRAALAEVGAEERLKSPVQALSGGELQRVLLARAILRDPDLLVLDEPVQNVDVGGQLELYDLIAGLRTRRGCGILLISHDLHVVMAQTDRVVCLNGHVCCAGPPDEVAAHPEYLALFGDRAAGRLAVFHHDLEHHHEHHHHDHHGHPPGDGAT
jgi:zinc transport system ATP-binding protein